MFRFQKNSFFSTRMISAVAVIAIIVLYSANVSGQFKQSGSVKENEQKTVNELAPAPIPLSGNPTCASINPSWGEYKLDFEFPNGSFPFSAAPQPSGRSYLAGGTGLAQNPDLYMNVSSSGATMTQWSLSPINQIDRLIVYVIVKGGSNANGYSYPTGSIGDTGSFTTQASRNAISHLTFCFDAFSGPSSAPVSISGRALTSEGSGIAYTRIDVMNLSTGEVVTALTNQFGYYIVSQLEAESIYMVTANHRRYTFINNQRTMTPSEDLVGVDFVAP